MSSEQLTQTQKDYSVDIEVFSGPLDLLLYLIKKEEVEMPKQDPKVRVKNFNEVALGYTEEQAFEIIALIENNPYLEPYTEALEGKTLVSNLNIEPGAITETSINDETQL